jgi:hypothetical protein
MQYFLKQKKTQNKMDPKNQLQRRTLPTIEQLYSEDERIDLAKHNDLNRLLNQQPNLKWLLKHPIAKKKVDGKDVPIDYIPIQRVEWLLTHIFIIWYVEIKTIQLIANAVVIAIRLHYQNPIDGQMLWQDGVGAAPLQTDKDKGAADWNYIKSSAVQIASPAAESYAIKDAAEKIGKLFGKDLNRADQIGYDNLGEKFKETSVEGVELRRMVSIELDKFKDNDLVDYQGIETEVVTLKQMCQEKEEANEFTLEFGNEILKALHNGKK